MEKDNRDVSKCSCPYCQANINYFSNQDDYVFQLCYNCNKYFWIRPINKDMISKLGKNPNTTNMLTKHEIGLMIDVGLLWKDWEMVKEYQSIREKMESDDCEFIVLSVMSKESVGE